MSYEYMSGHGLLTERVGARTKDGRNYGTFCTILCNLNVSLAMVAILQETGTHLAFVLFSVTAIVIVVSAAAVNHLL